MPEVSKIPVTTVVISRDSGRKNPKGEAIFTRITPPLGKPFPFTEEEVKDITGANPLALREPVDETELPKAIKQAAEKAAEGAKALPMGGAAAGDAAQVAVTAARGKKPSKVAGNPAAEGDAMISEDDSDTL